MFDLPLGAVLSGDNPSMLGHARALGAESLFDSADPLVKNLK